MKHATTITALIAAIALTALTIPAALANPPADVPLENEPPPISEYTSTVFVHTVTPDTCTLLSDGLCLERVETWVCPAGLSDAALERRVPSYNESITNPRPYAVAYLDSHCELESSVPATPAPAVPDQFVDANGNICFNDKNDVGDVIAVRCVEPITSPQPAFTG